MSQLIKDLRKAYVEVLHKHDKIYHFDDDASEYVNARSGKPTFTSEEVRVVSEITNALHHEELFEHAIRLTNVVCPNCRDVQCAGCSTPEPEHSACDPEDPCRNGGDGFTSYCRKHGGK